MAGKWRRTKTKQIKKTRNTMNSQRELLDYLFQTGQIDIKRGKLFDIDLSPMPPSFFDFNRVEGMMLGLAIGDALGRTTEGLLPGHRQTVFGTFQRNQPQMENSPSNNIGDANKPLQPPDNSGEIRDYLPSKYANHQCIGMPSDDTQLAFWTLEQMIADEGFNPEHIAERFNQNHIFGLGSTVWHFLINYKSQNPWFQCGVKSAGNGALMRIAPMLIPHLKFGKSDLWVDTAMSAMLTHNDSGSIAACLSFIYMLWQLLKMKSPPQPDWWLKTYVEIAQDLEINNSYCPRGSALINYDYRGFIWQFVVQAVGEAYRQDLSVVDACNQWYSGAYLLETVPSVIYILMKYGNNPEEAIVRAVNDTVDNDTIAAIVGAAVGALHGKDRLPQRWIQNLSGRTKENDDGRVFELLQMARKLWWENPTPPSPIHYLEIPGQDVKPPLGRDTAMPCPPSEKPPETLPCPPITQTIPQQKQQKQQKQQTAKNMQDAALGCFLGAVVGDAAGAVLEFIRRQATPEEVDAAMKMSGGGIRNLNPGQITDDTELAICLARALCSSPTFDREKIARSYAKWVESKPFDMGLTTSRSLGCFDPSPTWRKICQTEGYAAGMSQAAAKFCLDSKANGSLMRIAPLGIWGHRLDDEELAHFAQEDSKLSHPNPSCCDAVACYTIAIASLIRQPGARQTAMERAERWALSHATAEVRGWLENAHLDIEIPYYPQIGFVKIAFIHAFRHLIKGSSFVEAIQETLFGGGDTDTNACIVGGLIGAACGAASIPKTMIHPVLNYDSENGTYPRPKFLHPRQVPQLVKSLLMPNS
jgi:ADP-ribosyl-[dinitrogen reductase] hydrolase